LRSRAEGARNKTKRKEETLDWFVRGGILMGPILALSVIALGIFLERLWVLRRSLVLPEEPLRELEGLLRKKKIPETRTYCQQHPSPLARVLFAGLQQYGNSRELIKENMEERGKAEALELKKYIGLLHTIASVSPLLGLLGTVSGMIKVFNAISVDGVGNPSSLSIGISEALITTVAGLTVAIPTFLGQRYLAGHAERLVHTLEEYATYLLNLLTALAPPGEEERT
jgi:biopolymer transport protein ExbB